jgi:hypothetical protein
MRLLLTWPAMVGDVLNPDNLLELKKINDYKAPRDKMICILNCCKVIYNLLNKANTQNPGADDFLPILIYVLLQANPKCLHTNLQYPDSIQCSLTNKYTSLIFAIQPK